MQELRGIPSKWLLRNSKGYPDFLFTILTYSLILLIFLTFFWVVFAILAFFHAGSPQAATLVKILDNMKTGLVSLAGVVFGLAGSYTVRRYKYDDHYLKKKINKQLVNGELPGTVTGLNMVTDQEDI
jgi:H+/Cl- antiporter ClcA